MFVTVFGSIKLRRRPPVRFPSVLLKFDAVGKQSRADIMKRATRHPSSNALILKSEQLDDGFICDSASGGAT